MSNLFSDSATRETVSNLIKKQFPNTLISITSTTGPKKLISDVMQQVKEPTVKPFSTHELYEIAYELGLTLFRPLTIPALQDYKLSQLGPDIPGLLNLPPDLKVAMPLSDKEARYPVYRPTYQVYKPDTGLATLAVNIAVGKLQHMEITKDEFNTMVDPIFEVLKTSRYGSGSLRGQLIRLSKNYEVAFGLSGFHKNKTLLSQGYSLDLTMSLLTKTLPLESPSKSPFPLTYSPLQYLLNPEESEQLGITDLLPPMSPKKASGLPFVGKTKGQELVQNLVLADYAYWALASALSQSLEKSTSLAAFFGDKRSRMLKEGLSQVGNPNERAALKEAITGRWRVLLDRLTTKDTLNNLLASDFWYFGCGLLSPKAEQYKIQTWEEKTRNIFAAPTPAFILGGKLSTEVMENSFNCLNNPETPSLYKINFLQGGMDDFVKMMLAKSDKNQAYIYADNIYIYMSVEDTWYSIDLAKGEANSTPSHVSAIGYYLLSRGWVDLSGKPLFNKTWAYLALKFLPDCFTNTRVLLGNAQLYWPGQGSGIPWTFLVNHLISTLVWDQWNIADQPSPSSDYFLTRIPEKLGVDFKIEKSTPNFLESLRNLPSTNGIVESDLLGWDITYDSLYGYIPILAKDRLFPSIFCPKTDLSKQTPQYLAAQVARRAMNHAMGGWYYPIIAEALLEQMQQYYQRLLETKGDLNLEDLLETAIKESDLGHYYEEGELNILRLITGDWREIFFSKLPRLPKVGYSFRTGLSTPPVHLIKSATILPPELVLNLAELLRLGPVAKFKADIKKRLDINPNMKAEAAGSFYQTVREELAPIYEAELEGEPIDNKVQALSERARYVYEHVPRPMMYIKDFNQDRKTYIENRENSLLEAESILTLLPTLRKELERFFSDVPADFSQVEEVFKIARQQPDTARPKMDSYDPDFVKITRVPARPKPGYMAYQLTGREPVLEDFHKPTKTQKRRLQKKRSALRNKT